MTLLLLFQLNLEAAAEDEDAGLFTVGQLQPPQEHPGAQYAAALAASGMVPTDPTTLDAPLRDEIQWFQEFDVPVLPEHQTRPGTFVIDTETLAEGLRDEIQWFQEFSVPVLPEHQTRSGLFIIDSETLGDALDSKLEYFQEFSVPVLPEHQTRLGLSIADPETLGDPLGDKIEWFSEFPVPVLPENQTRLGWFVIDTETLAEGLRDEIQWFQPLSDPLRAIDRVIDAGNIFVDEPLVVVAEDELEWFQALSHPAPLPEWRQPTNEVRYPGVIQEARPASDVSGNWTPSSGSDSFEMINEVAPDDSDFIRSPENPTSSAEEVLMSSVVTPDGDDNHVVHYRYRKEPTDGPPIDLTVTLLDGVTTIATFTHTNISGTVRMAHQPLTLVEAANIVNYANLRLRFTADQP